MSITGIGNANSAQSIYQLYLSQLNNSTASAQTSGSSSSGSVKSDSVDFSKPGELFSKLQQLQSSDPEKFKQVCADIAQKLNTAAQADGSNSKLSDLAKKFQSVADGGDISQLQPTKHHHHHAQSSAAQNGTDTYSQNSGQSLVNLMQGGSDSSSSQGSIKDVMQSILAEVDQALAA